MSAGIVGHLAGSLAGGLVLGLVEAEHIAAPVIWFAAGLGLGAMTFTDEVSHRSRPAAYMRSRLWPTLGHDRVVRPGDPPATQRAAA
jgi:hypothetical protein